MDAQETRRHVVITGSGGSGSSFLVELLANLGLDTGYKGLKSFQKNGEDSFTEESPYIVESSVFHQVAKEILHRKDLTIDHIFIPIRDLRRRRDGIHANSSMDKLLNDLGRLLWETDQFASPEEALQKARMLLMAKSAKANELATQDHVLERLYQLLLATSDSDVPVTFMHFPRILQDSRYLYAKLQPILGGVTYEFFRFTFAGTVRTDLVTTLGRHCHREDSDPVLTSQAA
jgi:hypothetical protein